MKPQAIKKVTEHVISKYPKLEGRHPKITEQAEGKYLFVFNYTDELPGNRKIENIVRVVSDEDGKILKMSSSKG